MKYFTLEELTHTSTGLTNIPDETQAGNLYALVNNILDPLREAFGAPIRINSGFRSEEVNRAVNGARKSQHLLGEAADITGGSKENNRKLFKMIQDLHLPFDQVILYGDGRFIHVSHSQINRKQVFHFEV